MDTDLQNDNVKFVEYRIFFVKRDREAILVNDHTDGCWVRQRSEQARRKVYRQHGKGTTAP